MTMTKEEVKNAAMELNPIEREELAEELFRSLPDLNQEEIDAAWLEEIHRRSKEYEEGRVTAKPVDEVIARIRASARH
jgi:putative addiction module component (TIGR02574 family)